MVRYFPQIASAIILSLSWGLVFLWIWGLHRQWWRIAWVRRALWMIPSLSLLLVLGWALLTTYDIDIPHPFAFVLVVLVIMGLGLAITLPISGITLSIERLVQWFGQRSDPPAHPPAPDPAPRIVVGRTLDPGPSSDPAPHDAGRRSFLTTAAAAIPLATVGAGSWGIIDSYRKARIPFIPFTFKNLPTDLDGLRILHISDIHLGYWVGLDYLEQTLLRAERARPDLVLVTGDVADDLKLLPTALRMIDQLRPRFGTYGSIGNHEYYRGIETVLDAFDHGPIPLLRDAGASVTIGQTQLFLGGADDPARMHDTDGVRFLRQTVDHAFDGAPSDAFHLLMSHRPRGFDAAAALGVPMTISGHTHGGIQLGIGGRSPLEPLMPEQYLWGHYRKGESQLYTSAGVGHWFPFRLACPREAPVYVLRKG
jgi:predicted MPP superfamily phosphohydrolase